MGYQIKMIFGFVFLGSWLGVSIAQSSYAQVQIKAPTLRGDGCSGSSSASATLAPDGSAVSILYDDFVARAGLGTGLRMKRTSCIMDIPVQVPPKVQVAITQTDVRGYNALPLRGYAQFTTQYSLSNQLMPVILRRFTGPVNSDYQMSNRLRQTDLKWSACGTSTLLSINTSIVVQTNEKNEVVVSSIDSSDIQAGSALKFALTYRSCN